MVERLLCKQEVVGSIPSASRAEAALGVRSRPPPERRRAFDSGGIRFGTVH